MNQMSNRTWYNRHPEMFNECKDIINENNKILSFGCSTGEEVYTLKDIYFPNSQIDGFDINTQLIFDNIQTYEYNENIRFFFSLDQLVPEDYDIVFCLSVLTRNPDPDKTYTFDLFEETLEIINRYIKHGGYLCIWNSLFEFTDSNVSKNYVPILTKHTDSGSTQKYYKDYITKKETNYPFVLFKKK